MFHFFNAITNAKGDSLVGYMVTLVDTVSGALTPIYADNSGTAISVVSGIANTALTDADGNVGFFVPSGNYNLRITSPTGVILRTITNVPMGNINLNSAYVDWTRPGGGSATVIASKVSWRLDAEDFFPAGWNPATDDMTTYMQQAVNAAAASGRTLYLPPKIIHGALTLPANTALRGVGCKTTVTPPAGSYDLYTVTGSDCTIENVAVQAAAKTGGWEFTIACGTGTVERTLLRNINTFNSRGALRDTGTTGYHITTRVEKFQARGHNGPGVLLNHAFAFIFFDEGTVDFTGVSTSNYTGFLADMSAVGASNAGGLFVTGWDILGTAGAYNLSGQNGFVMRNVSALWMQSCRSDTVYGLGYSFLNINVIRLLDVTAAHVGNHSFVFQSVTNGVCQLVNALGSRGLAWAVAGADGVRFVSGCDSLVFSGGVTRDQTGNGVYKVAAQTGPITFNGFQSVFNQGYGVATVGNSAFTFSSGLLNANTAGDYTLGGAYDYIAVTQRSSGSLTAVIGPGPVSG